MTDNYETEHRLAIMEIERFAVHDGPGIRTVVFLQGCPLRCPWCSNPESQQIKTHLLHLGNRCVGCGHCEAVCPSGSITFTGHHPLFDRQRCDSCKTCATICVQGAIKFTGQTISSSDIMEIVLRDRDYYQNSGGGVTFSGGEAFNQFEGLMDLLTRCKEEKLHTAVETCGQVDFEKIKRSYSLIDLYLFDLKHPDKEILKQTTGADLDIILTNLRYITLKKSDKVIVRIPCIPGFNLHDQAMRRLFTLAKEAHVKYVHLLPYHILGKDKDQQMGLPYPYDHSQMLSKEDLIPYKKMGEEMGLVVQIGG